MITYIYNKDTGNSFFNFIHIDNEYSLSIQYKDTDTINVVYNIITNITKDKKDIINLFFGEFHKNIIESTNPPPLYIYMYIKNILTELQ